MIQDKPDGWNYKMIGSEAMPSVDLTQLGRTGLNIQGGLIYEEFLPQLSGSRAIRLYKEMSQNDPICGAVLFAIEMLVRQVPWRVEAVSEDRTDQEAAAFLESCLDDMSFTWQDTIAEILSMLIYGWSYHEIVYKRRLGDSRDPSKRSRHNDGRIGWRKLPIRSQDTLYQWEFDENGGVQGMVQQTPPDYSLRYIPIEKGLLFRTTSHKGNPEGRSILRSAYRPWYFKKHIEEIEGIGIERDLAGLPVAFVPPELLHANATPEERTVLDEIKRIVRNVRRDEQEGIIFPLIYDERGNKMYDFQLLSTGGRRQFDTDAIITRYDQRIAMTALADFILLGTAKVGSFALSSDKTHLFSIALGAWLDGIAAVFNRHAIPRLFALNGFTVEQLPTLVHADIESPNLKEIGDFISALSGSGMPLFPNDELEEYLLRVANLPIAARGQE